MENIVLTGRKVLNLEELEGRSFEYITVIRSIAHSKDFSVYAARQVKPDSCINSHSCGAYNKCVSFFYSSQEKSIG